MAGFAVVKVADIVRSCIPKELGTVRIMKINQSAVVVMELELWWYLERVHQKTQINQVILASIQ